MSAGVGRYRMRTLAFLSSDSSYYLSERLLPSQGFRHPPPACLGTLRYLGSEHAGTLVVVGRCALQAAAIRAPISMSTLPIVPVTSSASSASFRRLFSHLYS